MSIDRLLKPASVAIVGASPDPKKISGMLVDFLLRSGFPGRIYPVNPRYDVIRELTCYASVDALPETVDLLVCVVPVAVAFDSIVAAATKGVPYCLLMTGGFGEGRSGAIGNERKARLLDICRQSGMHVVGPNTVGMVNFLHRMPLTFADWYGRDTGQRGGVAIVTHSGSVGGLIFSSLQINRIGVDYWIGLGNEATLETADFISHFSGDPGVHTIVCFMEGVVNGRKFMAAAEKARRNGKTVVVLKSGKSPESVRATLSHTTKNPTSADVYAGIFRQVGVVEVSSLAELVYVVKLITGVRRQPGHRVGILSASGGACSLLADQVIASGLAVPELPAALQERLNQAIPEYGSSRNPVDLSADVVSRREILDSTLSAIDADDSIDVWMVFGRPVIDRYYRDLAAFSKASSKTVIVSSAVPLAQEVQDALLESGVAVMDDPELCLRALGAVHRADFAVSVKAPPRDWNGSGDLGVASAASAADALAGIGVESTSAAATLRISVEQDEDFGPILTLSSVSVAGRSRRRAVRALPVVPEDIGDMVRDLEKAEGDLAAMSDSLEKALIAVADAAMTKGGLAALVVDLAVSHGRLVTCAIRSNSEAGPRQLVGS
ncbi:MAG: acetate--CoA ligase family protein [Bacteroidota bacterium]